MKFLEKINNNVIIKFLLILLLIFIIYFKNIKNKILKFLSNKIIRLFLYILIIYFLDKNIQISLILLVFINLVLIPEENNFLEFFSSNKKNLGEVDSDNLNKGNSNLKKKNAKNSLEYKPIKGKPLGINLKEKPEDSLIISRIKLNGKLAKIIKKQIKIYKEMFPGQIHLDGNLDNYTDLVMNDHISRYHIDGEFLTDNKIDNKK